MSVTINNSLTFIGMGTISVIVRHKIGGERRFVS
jgi:hypothetical protein